MHSDIHLQLHAQRAAELHREAAEFRQGAALRKAPGPRRPHRDLRTHLGWSLIELGLRLITRPRANPRTHLA